MNRATRRSLAFLSILALAAGLPAVAAEPSLVESFDRLGHARLEDLRPRRRRHRARRAANRRVLRRRWRRQLAKPRNPLSAPALPRMPRRFKSGRASADGTRPPLRRGAAWRRNCDDLYLCRYAPGGNDGILALVPLDFHPVPGVWYDLRLVVAGPVIEVYLGEEKTPRIRVSDPSGLAAGKVVLGGGWVATEFDDLSVRLLPDERGARWTTPFTPPRGGSIFSPRSKISSPVGLPPTRAPTTRLAATAGPRRSGRARGGEGERSRRSTTRWRSSPTDRTRPRSAATCPTASTS